MLNKNITKMMNEFKNRRLSRYEKENAFDSLMHNYQKEMLYGILLSDGHIRKVSEKANANFLFGQTKEKNSNYMYYLFVHKHFFHYISPNLDATKVKFTNKVQSKGKYNKETYAYLHFHTMQLPCFNEFREMYYKDKTKIVPYNIENLITPLSLAHWIMGDGSNSGRTVRLHTMGFKLEEIKLLSDVLLSKFNLINNISKNKNIDISIKSMPELIRLVYPYMINEMLYKLNIPYPGDLKRVILPEPDTISPLTKLPFKKDFDNVFLDCDLHFKVPINVKQVLTLSAFTHLVLTYGTKKHGSILLLLGFIKFTDLNLLLESINNLFNLKVEHYCSIHLLTNNSYGIYLSNPIVKSDLLHKTIKSHFHLV